MVTKAITRKQVPSVLLLSGGHTPTLQQAVEAHAIMFEEAKEITKAYFH